MPELEQEVEVRPHFIARIDRMLLSHEAIEKDSIPHSGLRFSVSPQVRRKIVHDLDLRRIQSSPSVVPPLLHVREDVRIAEHKDHEEGEDNPSVKSGDSEARKEVGD